MDDFRALYPTIILNKNKNKTKTHIIKEMLEKLKKERTKIRNKKIEK